MCSKSIKKTFDITLSTDKTLTIAITEPNVSADNLSLTTWTSSFILANQLQKLNLKLESSFDQDGTDNTTTHIPILELGAGTGLVGITASILYGQPAILTDLPSIVPSLRNNIDLNTQLLVDAGLFSCHSSSPNTLQCGTLDWKKPETLILEPTHKASQQHLNATHAKAHLILAADTLYDEDHPTLICTTISTWLSRTPGSRAVLCYPLRVAYLDQIREVWTLLEELRLESESHGQERADEERGGWDDECLCEWVVWRWREV